jgi:hypothetical protein
MDSGVREVSLLYGQSGIHRTAAQVVLALAALLFLTFNPVQAAPLAKSVAFLGVQFLNDNEALEPTTDAERARLQAIAALFKHKLETSGRYAFVALPPDFAAKLANGATIGSCGGCEFVLGADAHTDLVAWLVVQKVSNLILNINVYMADVASKKLTLVHSVDIRGNTYESWTRGMNYLVKNYVLAEPR